MRTRWAWRKSGPVVAGRELRYKRMAVLPIAYPGASISTPPLPPPAAPLPPPATPCHPQVTVYVYQLVDGDVKVEKIDYTKAP